MDMDWNQIRRCLENDEKYSGRRGLLGQTQVLQGTALLIRCFSTQTGEASYVSLVEWRHFSGVQKDKLVARPPNEKRGFQAPLRSASGFGYNGTAISIAIRLP
jgi:hypothetical protein